MVPSHDTETCAVCHGPVIPFGRLRHRFVDGDVGPLCLSCARRLLPRDVADAEALEVIAAGGEKENY
jgi:RNase P subunit RPR2